jgi:hypothetical protein
MNNQETIEILEELLNCVKTIGFKKTQNILKIEKSKELVEIDDYDKFVLQTIIEEFDITLDELLFGRYIRGEIKYAIGFAVYFLYENKTLGQIHKRIFKFKNKTLLSKYRQIIFDLNKSHKADEKFILMKEKMSKKIENFKKDNQ